MKSIFITTTLFITLLSNAHGQVPQAFTYQAVARDNQQKPMAGANLTVDVSILRNGNPVFQETHEITTGSTGLFVVNIGTGNPAAFQSIDWSAGSHFLKIDVSGELDIDAPAAPILSVPYAFLARDVLNKPKLVLDGQILSLEGSNSVTLPTFNLTAGPGITIIGNEITNSGDPDPDDDLTNTSQASGDITGPFNQLEISPKAVGTPEINDKAITGEKIAPMNAAQGQVLKWDGTTWTPQNDIGGGVGDNWGSQVVVTDNSLAGNGSSTAPLRIPGNSITGNLIMDGSVQAGDLAAGIIPSTLPPSGSATGDLTGNYPNPTVIGIQGRPLAQNPAPTTGNVLKWNGSSWAPAADEAGNDNWGNQVVITGNTLTGNGTVNNPLNVAQNTIGSTEIINGSIQATDLAPGIIPSALPPSGNAGGDLFGLYPNPVVDAVQGRAVSAQAPANGQVLKWNQTTQQWEPQPDVAGQTYLAGSGISITGDSIINIGDKNAADDLLVTSTAGGDVSGTFATLAVEKIRGLPVAITTPASGQVLKWNGSAWTPATDETGVNYAAGPGISLNGSVITNNGDTSNTNEIQSLSIAGNKLSISSGNQVTLPESPWIADTTGINYPGGTVKALTNSGSKMVEFGEDPSGNAGFLEVFGSGQKRNVRLDFYSNRNNGSIYVYGPDGSSTTPPIRLFSDPNNSNSGTFELFNGADKRKIFAGVTSTDLGILSTFGPSGNVLSRLTATTANQDCGVLGVYGPNSGGTKEAALLFADPDTGGGGALQISDSLGNLRLEIAASTYMGNPAYARFYGKTNGKTNTLIGYTNSNGDHGSISVYGTNASNPKANMFVDDNGHGKITLYNSNQSQFVELGFLANGTATLSLNGAKSFRMPHPRDTTKEIWYACVEGPEAAAYERGTATLQNGEAFVPFSDHFGLVIAAGTLTVMITPLSADTDGLAVVEKTPTGFRVKELRHGQGNFAFDWEAKAVRKGYENFEVIRPKQHLNAQDTPAQPPLKLKSTPVQAPPGVRQ